MAKADNFKVNLSLNETVKILDSGIVNRSIKGERIDYHIITGNDTTGTILLVYEKYSYRAGGILTLTIIIDNMSGVTNIHSIGSGSGEDFFGIDWGANKSFTSAPRTILNDYLI